ncbi:MAG: hypothetical protein AB7O57_21295 [Hyphomicrobiaceae bacterium]
MDVLGWLWWLVSGSVALVWSVVWFLLGGWVSTLAQIAVVVLVVFGYKYGWRRAPQELMSRLGGFGRFAWGWLRFREGPPQATPRATTAEPRGRRGPAAPGNRSGRHNFRNRQPGDVRINVSTCLTLLMLAGLWLLAAV